MATRPNLFSVVHLILLIDNYDSFTYNVAQYLGELGAEVEVARNDQISLEEVRDRQPEKVVLSPGPCTPNEAGVCMDLIDAMGESTPILGICLGHQCIGQVFGGSIVRAREVMHGKLSSIRHSGTGVFESLADGFTATRYHSLVVDRTSLPDCLELTAWTEFEDGSLDEIMGLQHKNLAIHGVQFHPESIMTEHGHSLLKNFLEV